MTSPRRPARIWTGILALGGGVLGAQLVTIAALPLLSRLYSPAEFGVLALVISMVAVLAPVVTLRLESAILLPTTTVGASAVFYVALTSALTLSLLSGAALWALQGVGVIAASANYATFPLWVAIISLLSATFTLVGQFALRRRRYGAVAGRSVVQSIAINGSQVGFGLLSMGGTGLLLGASTGRLVGIVPLFLSIKRELGRVTIAECTQVFKRYWRFPTLFTLSGLLNALGLQAPILLAGLWFSVGEVGQLGMAERVLFIPLTVVGGAIAQVLEAEVSDRLRARTRDVLRIFLKLSAVLTAVSIALIAGVLLLAGWLVPAFLGAEWRQAAVLMQVLVFPVAARLIASPTSRILTILQLGRITLGLDILRVVLLGVAATWVFGARLDFVEAMAALYVALGVTYVLTWCASLRAAVKHDSAA